MPKVTQEHKKAMAEGRQQAAAIRTYLDALESQAAGRKRGRPRTAESIQNRLAALAEQISNADPLKRVQLIQEKMDLENELYQMEQVVEPEMFEEDFVAAVKGYSERKGITYHAWRELGVPAATLKRAGLSRSS
jgi:glutamine synthetase type III